MAEYTVTDSKTGREITFEWNDTKPPTQQDMLSVFAEANRQTKPLTNPATDQNIMSSESPTPEWAVRNPNLYGLYGAGRELYKTVVKPAIETLGMVGGGMIGAGSGFLGGAGLGAIPGGAMGAGLGYAGARNLTGVLDQAFDVDRGITPTMSKALKSSAKDFALGAVGGPPAKPAIKAATASTKPGFGISLLPGEQTGSATLAQTESLMEQTPFASDIIKNWRNKEQLEPLVALRNKYLEQGMENTPRGEVLGQQIRAAIDKRLAQFDKAKVNSIETLRNDILKQLGSKESYETLSRGAQEIINKKSLSAVQQKNKMYEAVADAMPQGELPFSNYQQEAQRYIDELTKLPNQDKELMNILKWGTNVKQSPEELKFLESIAQYPPEIQQKIMKEAGITKLTEVTKDWQTMQNHRNQLSDLIKANDLSIKNNAPNLKGQLSNEGRIYKNLQKALDSDFEQIAKDKGGDVLDKWNAAQAFYSNEYAPVWKQKTIRDMAYKNPSSLVDVAIKPNSTTEVELAKKALGEEGFNSTLKPAFTNKLLKSDIEGSFNPVQFEKSLNSYGDEVLTKIYTPSELRQLRNVAKNGQLIIDTTLPNSSILKSFSKIDNGQVLINSVLSAIEKHPSSTTLLKNLSTLNGALDKPLREGLKLELLERVFKVNQTTQYVEPTAMAKNIYNLKDSLKLYMTKEEMSDLNKLATLANVMSRAQQMAANPSGTAKNVIAFGTANELIFKPAETLMKGDILKSAGQVAIGVTTKILGARKLAEMYVNQDSAMRKLILKAMTTPRYTSEGMDIAKKLSIVFGNEYLSDTEQ